MSNSFRHFLRGTSGYFGYDGHAGWNEIVWKLEVLTTQGARNIKISRKSCYKFFPFYNDFWQQFMKREGGVAHNILFLYMRALFILSGKRHSGISSQQEEAAKIDNSPKFCITFPYLIFVKIFLWKILWVLRNNGNSLATETTFPKFRFRFHYFCHISDNSKVFKFLTF